MKKQRPAGRAAWSGGQPKRDRELLGFALAVSLYLHSLLLLLVFGAPGLGFPGLAWPWTERRVEAPPLRLRMTVNLPPAPESASAPSAPPAIATARQPTPDQPPRPITSLEVRLQSAADAAASQPRVSLPRRETLAKAPAARTRARERKVRAKPPPRVLAQIDPQQETFNVPPPRRAEPEAQRAPESAARKQTEEPPPAVQSPEPSERRQAEEAARLQADEAAARQRAEEDARQRALTARKELEAKKQEEARRQAQELEARKLAEDAARQQAEERARQRALAVKEQEAKKVEEAKRADEARKEQEAKVQEELKKQDEVKRLAVEEASRQAEVKKQEEAKRAALEVEALRRAEELARQQALARQKELEAKKQAEARRQAEEAAARAKELADRQQAEAEAAARREREGLAAKQAPAGPGALSGKELAAKALEQLRTPGALRDELMRPPAPAARAENPRRKSLFGVERDVSLRMYVDSWRWKIERSGQVNYRPSASWRAHENPIVTVAIRSDGSLEDVMIHRSSGVRELDDAVRRIARLHAPYSAFPPELARQYDVIEIRRVWFFDGTLKILDEM